MPDHSHLSTQDLNHLIHKLSAGSRLKYEQQKEFAEGVEESWNLSQGLSKESARAYHTGFLDELVRESEVMGLYAPPSPVEAIPHEW